MTWHRVWGIKCNAEECNNIFVTENPAEEPEGWASDGTRHLCKDCADKQREAQAEAPAQEPVEEPEPVAVSS